MLWGPRQVGKTTLLDQLPLKSKLFLDDLAIRQRAQNDPSFVLSQLEWPCLIDEAQYAPNLFPEIKRIIDELRRKGLKKGVKPTTQFYLTGSNRSTLDKTVKESLAGRCHLFNLHGLSMKELFSHFKKLALSDIMAKGGFPELYTRENLSFRQYLNDYIISFVEKDIALGAGVEKIQAFHSVLRLLAARTGQFLNVSEVAKLSGVDQKTIHNWINLLSKNVVLELVPTFSTNLSKRIIKMKKLYFYDAGLCSRLQGFTDKQTILHSPQAGSLFETLVFSEIIKTRDNYLKDWQIYTWRTKEKKEIDFVLQSSNFINLIEVKMGMGNIQDFEVDNEAKKVFQNKYRKIIVSMGEKVEKLNKETTIVPAHSLGEYLLDNCG